MSNWGQLGLQDATSPLITQLILFHDHSISIIVLVLTFTLYFLICLMMNSFYSPRLLEAQVIETIWTIIPCIILLTLIIPSLRILYLIEGTDRPEVTIKSIGHQWYWSYEYSDFNDLEYRSYIIPENQLSRGIYRLLEVDNRAVLPLMTETRILVTATDVIHSWSVPRIGLKVDAIPGRLNQLSVSPSAVGVFYGQCSEICGTNHSFMPIVLEIVTRKSFINWSKNINI